MPTNHRLIISPTLPAMTPHSAFFIANIFAAVGELSARLATTKADRSFRSWLLREAPLAGNAQDLSAPLLEPHKASPTLAAASPPLGMPMLRRRTKRSRFWLRGFAP